MSGDDEKIWAQYAKDVTPLGKQEPPPKKKRAALPSESGLIPSPSRGGEFVRPTMESAPITPPLEVELDRRVEQNLRNGDVIIEARLDMHGMTLQEAYEALGAFIAKQTRFGKKLVLVITGKGREEETSLRAKFPRWCAEPMFAQYILALRRAAPHHGGEGAWYVVLRRKK